MIVAIGACEPAPQAGGASVRDSLGVRIVDHGDIDISALPQWSLEVKPVVSIGVAEGDDAYQLFGVIDAHRSGDGSIAVVPSESSIVWVCTSGPRVDEVTAQANLDGRKWSPSSMATRSWCGT